MKQRVYVNRAKYPSYIDVNENPRPPVKNESGFHVRDMNSRTSSIAKNDDFKSDIENALKSIHEKYDWLDYRFCTNKKVICTISYISHYF